MNKVTIFVYKQHLVTLNSLWPSTYVAVNDMIYELTQSAA